MTTYKFEVAIPAPPPVYYLSVTNTVENRVYSYPMKIEDVRKLYGDLSEVLYRYDNDDDEGGY